MKCLKRQTENSDTATFRRVSGLPLDAKLTCRQCGHTLIEQAPQQTLSKSSSPTNTPTSLPILTSFAYGRYHAKKSIGEGGKKIVYLAHDSTLDRDTVLARKYTTEDSYGK